MRRLLPLLLLAGCVSAPVGYWHRNGVRVDVNPALLAEFSRAKTICDGETAQAALASNEKDLLTHNRNVNLVFDGCLTKAGYVRIPG